MLDDADLDLAAHGTLFGFLLMSGQAWDDAVLSHSQTSGTPRGNRPRASSSVAIQRCAESHHTSISGTRSAALCRVCPP